MKLFGLIGLLVVICLSVCAQQAQPDRWKGLIIDESTSEDAGRILGEYASDKTERLRIFDVDSKWITQKVKQPIYRRLRFKKVEGVDGVTLSFLDNKLVLIEIDLAKESPAASLPRIYGIPFSPKISGLDEAFSPRDFERNQGRVYPKSYPTVYSLVAVSPKTFIGALVGNNSVGSILRKTAGVTDTGDFPGKVVRVTIVSRRLENLDGADALSSEPTPATTTTEPKQLAPGPAAPVTAQPTPTPEAAKKICFDNGRKVPCP
jgi:hypothetical protein